MATATEKTQKKPAAKSATATKSTAAKSTAGKSATTKKAADKTDDKKAVDKKTAPKTTAAKSSTKKAAANKADDHGSHTTTNHDEIKQWIESRGGKPATVKSTGKKGDAGILRIDYSGYTGEDTLQEISWDEFFEKFDESKLEFLYQDKTADGKESRFSKFVSRSK